MEIRIDVAKTSKFGSEISGDTVEVIERPQGGLSLIIADGQGSGSSAKSISSFVVNKAVGLIADGARDGTVARAVHDALFSFRQGKVSSSLSIISADLSTKTIVISHNSNCPIVVRSDSEINAFDGRTSLIGTRKISEPSIYQLEIKPDTLVVSFTDGIVNAGKWYGNPWDLSQILGHVRKALEESTISPAFYVLQQAICADEEKPKDDMTVACLSILPYGKPHRIRRMIVSMPL
jgi:serine phosphatase RsbU (regulator of sigma subunit)